MCLRLIPLVLFRLIRYIYTGDIEVTEANVFDLYHAANCLELDTLEDVCAEFLEGKLTSKNVGAFAKKAIDFNAQRSLQTCQEYFGKNASEIIKTKEFLQLPYDTILSLCSCRIVDCTQLQLFESCAKWAKEECNRQKKKPTCKNVRKVLGHILNKIQFAKIPLADFIRAVLPTEILTCEEVGRTVIKRAKKEDLIVKSYDGNEEVKVSCLLTEKFRNEGHFTFLPK